MLRTHTIARRARFLVILPFVALLACQDDMGPPMPGILTSITVTPNPITMPPSSGQQFVAVGKDNFGTVVSVTPITWSVVASGGAINSGSGMFAAGATSATFANTIKACNSTGELCGFATVIVDTLPAVGFPILGSAGSYGILAGASVTCAGPPGTINADVGISPGSTITGFGAGLCTITGNTELATVPAATAQLDLTTAFNVLASQPCGTTIVADLGGTTISPGVYCGASSVGVTGTLTLNGAGNSNAQFVIRAGSTLTTGTNATIALTNGTQAKNVFFWVGSSATLGTGTTFRGNIVALTTITLNGTVTMTGRALARNGSVSLAATGNTITLP